MTLLVCGLDSSPSIPHSLHPSPSSSLPPPLSFSLHPSHYRSLPSLSPSSLPPLSLPPLPPVIPLSIPSLGSHKLIVCFGRSFISPGFSVRNRSCWVPLWVTFLSILILWVFVFISEKCCKTTPLFPHPPLPVCPCVTFVYVCIRCVHCVYVCTRACVPL